MKVTLSNHPLFGAEVTGINLSNDFTESQIADIREIWLQYHVLSFPNQQLTDDDLERFTLYFGPFGDDPFIAPIEGRKHIIAVQREANETSSIFAENWHTDWSFQVTPPAGTCLYGIDIPPVGGDTLFANQHLALDNMPAELLARIEGKSAIHSAMAAYAPEGVYGQEDTQRSMDIQPSKDANATYTHPLIKPHLETGRMGLYGCYGYIVGIEGMAHDKALQLLMELYVWQSNEQFVYRHQWQNDMLIMWDNRSVLHSATGGFEGHRRLLHRTTIGAIKA